MNISFLRRNPDECGFIEFIANLQTQSHLGRKLLLRQEWLTSKEAIEQELDNIEAVKSIFSQNTKRQIDTLCMMLGEAKDIERTLQNLLAKQTLNEIELFEIKNFAFTVKKIFSFWRDFSETGKIKIKGLEIIADDVFNKVISLLDPENIGIPTFYIYNAYDERLSKIRQDIENSEEVEHIAQLQSNIIAIEEEVKERLTKELLPYTNELFISLNSLSYIDLLFSKAIFANSFSLNKPTIYTSGNTSFKGLFNPIEKNSLKNKGVEYQPIDISFGQYPTLITGINMGGKTLTLKTIGLCQMLLQYGFFVPAKQAEIALVDTIGVSLHDESQVEQGLSSFASEMKKINDIIVNLQKGTKTLVLIDELARTTNPKEGRAIVEAMLDILQEFEVSSFITTHYDITTTSRRLRVRGIKDNLPEGSSYTEHGLRKMIDYSLVEDTEEKTPNEALRIAEMLGVSSMLTERAKQRLK